MAAKEHYVGDTFSMTRRCAQGRNTLRTDPEQDEAIRYIYAYNAKKYGIITHKLLIMSNHEHFVGTDTTGNRSQFIASVNGQIARYLKWKQKIDDFIWDHLGVSDITLLDQASVEKQLVYVGLNPVEAGMVQHFHHYDGVFVHEAHWGKTQILKRPPGVLSTVGPDEIEFCPEAPPRHMRLEECPDKEARRLVRKIIKLGKKVHKRKRRERRAQGNKNMKTWTGMAFVRSIPHDSKHIDIAPLPAGRRRNVRFMAQCEKVREWAKARTKEFKRKYADALALKRDNLPAVFPAGTVKYRLMGFDVEPQTERHKFREVDQNVELAA